MPQLDTATFLPQIFWLVVTFVTLYLIMARVSLPRVSQVREQRAERIDGDLASAETMKEEADAAKAAYEKALADARARAQEQSLKTREALRARIEARQTALAEELAAKTRAAEAEIAKAKAEALDSVRDVAVEACRDILVKVSGLKLDDPAIKAAVDAEMKAAQKGANS